MPLIINYEKARQGHTGDGMRYVLACSLALALTALTVVFLSLGANL